MLTAKENTGALFDESGQLTNRDIDKAEMLNAFFAFVFNTDGVEVVHGPRALSWRTVTAGMMNSQPSLNFCRIWVHINLLGPDGIHPSVLIELADVITRPLSVILQQFWEPGEVPIDWRVANMILIFKMGKKGDPGNYRLVSLISVPGKTMEKIVLGFTEKHLKDLAVIGHSQNTFMRGKPCLTNLSPFYDKFLADQGKTVASAKLQ